MEEPWAPRSLREVRDKVWVSIDRAFEKIALYKADDLRNMFRDTFHMFGVARVYMRLPDGFAICTGAFPCGLRGARALARRVLQYARVYCPVDCGVHGRLPGGFCNMHRLITSGLARIAGACPTNLQCAQAPTPWTCRMHGRLPSGIAICTGAYLMDLQRSRGACPVNLQCAQALTPWTCKMHGQLHCLKKDASHCLMKKCFV
ncbi:hypothetical protein CRG98_002688 [Punica granatum]|uniref:Uncharacterized protein n=1 Tax=Punica granatum TaxID=22663 RepID=A0A2I0L869_PUNGR|nr:hypothetical protein CRG98_002688 [Punica granatum]